MVEARNTGSYSNSAVKDAKVRKSKARSALVEAQIQECLWRLGVNLTVKWQPDSAKSGHGEIKGNSIFLYDVDESEAWQTFTHEVTEYKLKNVTRPYRSMINSLIEAINKSIYAE